MIRIDIEPIDTLFFRDSRSFNAGVDNSAEFNYPSPLTFFGAIGSLILSKMNSSELESFFEQKSNHLLLGEYNSQLKKSRLRIKGPFLHINKKIYFPPPANLWKHGGKIKISCPDENNVKWDIKNENIRSLKIPENSEYELLNENISENFVIEYLSNDKDYLTPDMLHKANDYFYSYETRYGTALSKESKTGIEHHLYRGVHLRFKDDLEGKTRTKSGFTLFADGIESKDIPDDMITLGGERRNASIQKTDDYPSFPKQQNVLDKVIKKKRFFIYLITPSIFKSGWLFDYPSGYGDLKLVGAAINKPSYVSGWINSVPGGRGKPRPMKKTVPAGSVYFFEADKWDEEKINNFYNDYHFNKSLSHEYPCAGFGIGLIGSW